MSFVPVDAARPASRGRLRSGWGGTALVVAAWLLCTAWMRPLMLPDEGRYVGVAWDMLRTGDWLVPRLDGLPFFHKPPLFYWITGGAMGLFGPSVWAARAAPLLGALAAALALYLFARRWAPTNAARTLRVLVTLPFFFVAAQFANLDMLVAGCITVCVLACAHAALAGPAQARPVLAVGYLAAALGVLAKGLIGAVLPGLVLTVWLLALRRPRTLLGLLWLPGVALFAAVAAPWFIAMQRAFPDFFHYFFVVQHFQRFAGSDFNNVAPFWFYPAVLLVLGLPWTPWLATLARRAFWQDRAARPVRLLMLVWLVAIVGFFSLPHSKLVGYVLPALAPLAFLLADGAGLRPMPKLWRASAVLAVVACVVPVMALALQPRGSLREIGLALEKAHAPGEPVLFLHRYFYDVPFYARLAEPVTVIDSWADPSVPLRDNWRKELLDAAQFAEPSRAPVLQEASALPALICAAPGAWIVATREDAARYPWLARATAVAQAGDTTLWRTTPAALGVCSP